MRSLLWSQGLDLFNLDTGVFIRDCTTQDQIEQQISGVLGNFPEEFVADTQGLKETVRQDVRWLLDAEMRYLAVAVVVPFETLQKIGSLENNWQELDLSQKPELSALTAITETVAMLDRQAESEQDLSRARVRLWLSIIVRDAGHRKADERSAKMAINALSSPNVRVRNVYFLSNGEEQNATSGDALRHFAKLRLLMDVFGANGTSKNGWSSLRGKQGELDQSDIQLVSLNADEFYEHSYSALLGGELVKKLSDVRASGALETRRGGALSLDDLKKTVGSCVPFLADDAYGQERAQSDLRSALQLDLAAQEDVRETGIDKADVDGVLDILSSMRTRFFAFENEKRRNRFRETAVEFESAMESTRQRYGRVIGEKARQDKVLLAKDRENLLPALADLQLPTGEEGKLALNSYIDEVQDRFDKTAEVIDNSVRAAKEHEFDANRSRTERKEVLKNLDDAEKQLLPKKAFRTPGLFLLIMSTPILIYYSVVVFSDYNTIESIEDLFDALGPLFLLAASAAICALIAGIAMGRRYTRQRNQVLRQLTDRLRDDFSRLKTQHFAKLTVSHNRARLSDLTLILQRLQPDIRNVEAEQVNALAKFLLTDQANQVFQSAAVPVNQLSSLLNSALDEFDKSTGPRAKISGFLSSREDAKPQSLNITIGKKVQNSVTLETRAALKSCSLTLRETGRV